MSDSMKKFGLEFQLVNRSQNEFAKIMDQQKRLEKQLNNNIKAFNKFQSAVNNTSLDSSIKKLDKLTNSVKRYNDALSGAKGGSIGLDVGNLSGSSGSLGGIQDLLMANSIYDSIGNISNKLMGAMSSLPFGDILSSSMSSFTEGIATSITTGNIIPAITGAIEGAIDLGVGIYNTASDLVHSAIYSGFQKGVQLITNAFTTYIPQTLDRELNQAKLSAVLGNDALAQQLSASATKHAQTSSLSLQDMDFILPNLVMANKASGVTDSRMANMTELEMEAVKRLNFKDSGKGAGVQGSLVALQEMLSGDMRSLRTRFEIGGAAIDRIEAAGKLSPEKQMEQLIKELEKMGVTDEALNKVQQSTKSKMDRIEETLVDFFTNPTTGIFAAFLEPFEPAIDRAIEFLETGGGIVGKGIDIEGNMGQVTMLDSIINSFRDVMSKLGEVGLKLGEAFLDGFITQVDWAALWGATSGLLDTISTYFTPAFEILAGWVNDTFIPWLGDMDKILQDENVRQGILDFITGLTEVATNSLKMVKTIAEKMPTIADTVRAVASFVSTVQGIVDKVATGLQNALSLLTSGEFGQTREAKQNAIKQSTAKGSVKKAVGMPYVPKDDYPVLLHKGERVLTAQQNRQYNQGGSNVSIAKLSDTIVVREDADITKIANALVKKLTESKVVFGGAY